MKARDLQVGDVYGVHGLKKVISVGRDDEVFPGKVTITYAFRLTTFRPFRAPDLSEWQEGRKPLLDVFDEDDELSVQRVGGGTGGKRRHALKQPSVGKQVAELNRMLRK